MKLEFCVACGSKDDLQHRHLVPRRQKAGVMTGLFVITLCNGCHNKLHQQRYGAGKHSQRIKTAFAARRARGASIGRPKALMPDQRKEALQRLESGESRAAVARSYGVSTATVNRLVRPARPSGGLLEAGLVKLTDARTASQPLTLETPR